MRRILISLVVTVGAACAVALSVGAPTQAQTQAACPPGQFGNAPYCQNLPAACAKLTSKLSLLRGTFNRSLRTLSILAPITRLASGRASLKLHAAGQTVNFTAPIDSSTGRIRVTKSISGAQAKLGTGILTINYPGDPDTRPQEVRLRAANNRADLSVTRPTISPTGLLEASGAISTEARGVVRVQIEFVSTVTGSTITLEQKTPIIDGRWSLSVQLPANIVALIASRCGTVHSYTLFTGYLPRRIRGEMRAYQVLPAR